MNLEEEIANKMANEIAREIDFGILTNMLVEACGWTKIELFGHHKKEDIMSWCEKNVKDHYQHQGLVLCLKTKVMLLILH